MSKVIKWQYADFFESRRDKLVNILLSEIIFLKSHFKNTESINEQQCIKNALEKLENILIILKNNETELSESDFNKVIMLIYKIFKTITDDLISC